MVARREIDSYVRKIASEFEPEKVVLFGSYAKGRPSEDSDVDLLVIMRHGKRNVEQAIEIDLQLDRSFPLDLIVRTPSEIRRRQASQDMFLQSILEEGKVMYERTRS